jgi:uncharacterized protein (DUF58 family)
MSRSHIATASELRSLRDLELVARTTVEGLRQGRHPSPFHGYNAEFSQYRHYRPGDDLRYVDWKAFGRSDRLYTKQFRETTNLAALVVVDVSASMDYAAKFRLAQSVAAALGTLVLDQGDAVGLLAVGDRVEYLPPRSGHLHLRAFLRHVAALAPAGTRSIVDGLVRAASLLRRRGLVIAISDFYDDHRAIAECRHLARAGHDVIVVQTLAAEEVSLTVEGAVELVDSETGATVVVDGDTARADYEARAGAWLASFTSAVSREGLDLLRLTTADSLDRELRRYLMARRAA